MRLFLLLVLVAVLHAGEWAGKPVTRYKLPGDKLPLKDGAMITFFFPHTGSELAPHSDLEKVWVNFYEYSEVDLDVGYEITAQVIIKRATPKPVTIRSMVNGLSGNDTIIEMKIDDAQIHNNMWRLDLYKHDKYTMTVFFQGFYAGTHKFLLSLDNIKSVYLMSDYMNRRELEIPITVPNNNINALTVENFEGFVNAPAGGWKKNRLLFSNITFSLGTRIEMIAVIRAWNHTNHVLSALQFNPVGESSSAILIYQKWDNGAAKHELFLDSSALRTEEKKRCTLEAPVGEIHYLMLERKKTGVEETVTLTMKYNPGKPADPCVVTVSDKMRWYLDQTLNIMSQSGALLFHLDHNIPKKKREDL